MMDSPIDPHIAELLVRQWTNQASDGDDQVIDAWLEQDSAHSVLAEGLRSAWDLAQPDLLHAAVPIDVREGVWSAIRQTPGSRLHRQQTGRSDMRRPWYADGWRTHFPIIGVVAGIVILVMAWSMVAPRLSPPPSSVPMKSFATTNGQRAKVTLPDGSTVLLNAASTIRYARHFGSETRDIYLVGEALFTIARNEGAPFIVHTGNTSTRVLGTVFSVRHYATDTATHVVVGEGRVGVARAILAAGEGAVITADSLVTVNRGVDIATEFAWTAGRLVFYETPFRDAMADLNRWYGFTLHVSDPMLLDRRITTTLEGESASEAVRLLSLALRATPEWHGNVVTLSPEGRD